MESKFFYMHAAFGLGLTVIAYVITWIMWRVFRIMDHPNERSSHKEAVPRAGGISIVTTFLIGMVLVYYFGSKSHFKQEFMGGFVFSSLLIAVISFMDDLYNKTALFKFITHIVAVLVVLFSGIVIDRIALPGLGHVQLGWIGYAVSFIWILGLTNAYNFMDGIDGIAAGTAVIASLFFMAICYYQGSSFVYITSYTILAGSLGFLLLNFPPAKIFMGDVGSAFLGFVFATLAIIAARYDESHTSFLVMPLLLFNFIYDTFFTLVRRWMNGEKLSQAHRTHLYQLLNRTGYSHLEVTLLHYCMVFLQGLGALWMVQIPGTERLLVYLPFLLLQILYTVWVINKSKNEGLL